MKKTIFLLSLAVPLAISAYLFLQNRRPRIEVEISSAGAESSQVLEIRPRVIYGKDDRLDWYDVTDAATVQLADSTMAVLDVTSLSDNGDGTSAVKGYKFGDYLNLCASEPFREQITAAFCSAFLVSPNTAVTAGHCIRTAAQCQKTTFVFGFAIKQKGGAPADIPQNEIYSCRKIRHNEVASDGADFAVIELDRVVKNHAPLRLNSTASLAIDAPLIVIGHPAGLPLKVAGGAKVRSLGQGYFVANLDTYGGNSGSAVFNAVTGEVEGILVRGETDFVVKNNCRVSNVCPETGCRGEDVTSISAVLPHLSRSTNKDNL